VGAVLCSPLCPSVCPLPPPPAPPPPHTHIMMSQQIKDVLEMKKNKWVHAYVIIHSLVRPFVTSLPPLPNAYHNPNRSRMCWR
jgi:hypothetical protein